jgi:hypothetical protein
MSKAARKSPTDEGAGLFEQSKLVLAVLRDQA